MLVLTLSLVAAACFGGVSADHAGPRVKGTPTMAPKDVRLRAEPNGPTEVGTWELLEVVDGERKLILRFHAETGCSKFLGVRVTETPDTVTLAPLAAMKVSTEPTLCPGSRTDGIGFVTLSHPLGSRTLSAEPPDF